jgi:tRNA-Thr(GGU) m(6)t(6)A37 methyltransferase TsaA
MAGNQSKSRINSVKENYFIANYSLNLLVAMDFNESIILQPIGYVKTSAVGNDVKDQKLVSKIELRKDLAEALDGLSEFSHIFVLFYLHQVTDKEHLPLKVHPRGRMDLPLVGIYATRTNLRPNQIGVTVVELLKIEGTTLSVRGLDAFDGTPVLDVKPYDNWDAKTTIQVPGWRKKLEEEKELK